MLLSDLLHGLVTTILFFACGMMVYDLWTLPFSLEKFIWMIILGAAWSYMFVTSRNLDK